MKYELTYTISNEASFMGPNIRRMLRSTLLNFEQKYGLTSISVDRSRLSFTSPAMLPNETIQAINDFVSEVPYITVTGLLSNPAVGKSGYQGFVEALQEGKNKDIHFVSLNGSYIDTVFEGPLDCGVCMQTAINFAPKSSVVNSSFVVTDSPNTFFSIDGIDATLDNAKYEGLNAANLTFNACNFKNKSGFKDLNSDSIKIYKCFGDSFDLSDTSVNSLRMINAGNKKSDKPLVVSISDSKVKDAVYVKDIESGKTILEFENTDITGLSVSHLVPRFNGETSIQLKNTNITKAKFYAEPEGSKIGVVIPKTENNAVKISDAHFTNVFFSGEGNVEFENCIFAGCDFTYLSVNLSNFNDCFIAENNAVSPELQEELEREGER